jgi:hypothetical protein
MAESEVYSRPSQRKPALVTWTSTTPPAWARLSTLPTGGMRGSVKALAVDEERKAIKDYRKAAAKQGFGTFGDLLRAKLDSSSK